VKQILTLLITLLSIQAFAQNQAPVVSNLTVTVNDTLGIMYINFDVSDVENDTLEIILNINGDPGSGIQYNVSGATGNIGYPQFVGSNKQIEFYFDTLIASDRIRVEVYADDHKGPGIAEMITQVDSMRLRADMDSLVGTRHYTQANLKLQSIKDTMFARFNAHQHSLFVHGFQYLSYTAQNYIATQNGNAERAQHVIIDGHYDCVSNGPGADDNLSAVVAMLEASRILSKYQFHKNIKYIGFDLEELGLLGSKEYVKNVLTPADKITGVLNFEMIGYYSEKNGSQKLPAGFNQLFPQAYAAVVADTFKGNFITNVGNVSSSALVDTFVYNAKKYVPALKVISVKAPGKSTIAPDLRRSDHAAFWDANYPAVMLTDGANFRNKNYHTALDVVDSLNFNFIQQVLKATIATAASLAKPMHAGMASYDTTLFNPTGIKTKRKEAFSIQVMPNPAKEYTLVRIPKEMEAREIQLIDSKGAIAYCSSIQGTEHTVFTQYLPAGLYTVKVLGRGEWTSKLVIEL
jgi:hypothetical protein